MNPRFLLFAFSILLLSARLYASKLLGFGDSEALYASYALHPAPAFLDHPGLVGIFARTIGNGQAPTPATAHFVTALMATLFPWLVYIAARTTGASRDGAYAGALAVAVTPEIAVGLFAMTPDLLLALAWIFTLGLAARAVTEKPSSAIAAASFIAAGLVAGVGATAKVSGLLLLLALAWTYASKSARAHAKTPWPWAGLAIGCIAFAPVVLFEARAPSPPGAWPMLRHRFIDTQAGSGSWLGHIGAVVGGQLIYLSPLLAVVAVVVLLDLIRHRNDDAIAALLFRTTALPLVVLIPLCLWSKASEPHWLAPPLLALALHFARRYEAAEDEVPSTAKSGKVVKAGPSWLHRFRRAPRWATGTIGLAVAITAAAHAWVLLPGFNHLLLPAGQKMSDPKYDISNELYGWDNAIIAVRGIVNEESARGEIVVVGPHWVICAQLHAALGPGVRVGCATPIRDDFDTWEPRTRWQHADKVLFVTDNRFDVPSQTILPDFAVAGHSRVTVLRDRRIARTFVLSLLESRARS